MAAHTVSKYPARGDVGFGKFLADFLDLSRKDPEKGLEILKAFERNGAREDVEAVYVLYAKSLAMKDPILAIKWASELNDSIISNLALQSTFAVLLQKDPDEALQSIGPFKDRQWANSLMSQCLQSIAANDPVKSLDWIDANLKNYPSTYYSTLTSVLASIGGHEPAKLKEMMLEYDFGKNDGVIIQNAMFGMSSLNIDSAMTFAKSIDAKSSLNSFVLEGLCTAVFAKNADALTNLVMERCPENAVKILTNGICSWINNDFTSGSKWFSEQNQELQKALMMNGVAATAAATNPLRAVEMVDGVNFTINERLGLYGTIINNWGESNPGESLEWLASFGEKDQEKLIQNWVVGISRVDPKLIVEFVNASTKLSAEAKRIALQKLNSPSPAQ